LTVAFEPSVELQNYDSVAVLAFSVEPAYPRLTRSVLAELGELLETVLDSSVFRGVVIASNPTSFATGAELDEVAALEGFWARQFAREGQGLLARIERFPLPVVAAIRGFCLGGGLDLALACHGRVAAYDASFGHPGASIGIVTGWGGTERLPSLLGRAAALQMLLTAERVPATQALSCGLVDELAPSVDLVAVAARRARLMASRMAAPNSRLGVEGEPFG
jgi:enoyl-CoA hydratase/carnithine racemase